MKAATLLLFAFACSENVNLNRHCECAADPSARCLSADTCTLDSDCARGLTCAADGLCRVVTRRIGADHMLQDEFGIRQSMEVEIDTAQATVRWVQPNNDSKEVHCTLYGCVPHVDPKRHTIENYEKCALLETNIMVSREGQFSLFDPLQFHPPRNLDHCAGTFSPTEPIVTDLFLGCLAYGDSSLVAVSDLIAIPAGSLQGQVNVPDTTTCAHDWVPCVGPVHDVYAFGTCYGQECRARCQTPDDCTALAPGPWDCQFKATAPDYQRIGVCVVPTP